MATAQTLSLTATGKPGVEYCTMIGAMITETKFTTLIIGLSARSGRILERIADSIAYHTGFVTFGTFAGIFRQILGFIFDQLLGIVPGPAGVVEEHSQQLAGNNDACQEATQGFHLQCETDDDWGHDAEQCQRDQFLLRGGGGDAQQPVCNQA